MARADGIAVDRDLKNEPLAQPGTIQVNWQQRMDLTPERPSSKRRDRKHGQRGAADRDLECGSPGRSVPPGRIAAAPDLDRLTCRGGVLFEGGERPPRSRGNSSRRNNSGSTARGAKSMPRARAASPDSPPGRRAPLRRCGPHRALPPSADAAKLACLVRASGRAPRNIGNRKIVFHDQVQCVYGDLARGSRGSISTIPIRSEGRRETRRINLPWRSDRA